jgi:hypothetical protein
VAQKPERAGFEQRVHGLRGVERAGLGVAESAAVVMERINRRCDQALALGWRDRSHARTLRRKTSSRMISLRISHDIKAS